MVRRAGFKLPVLFEPLVGAMEGTFMFRKLNRKQLKDLIIPGSEELSKQTLERASDALTPLILRSETFNSMNELRESIDSCAIPLVPHAEK